MKKLFVILCLFTAASCSKVANHETSADLSSSFFSNQEQVSTIAANSLAKAHPGETFKSIDHISYMRSVKEDYAFVFFTTNVATRSLVVKKNHDPHGENLMSVTVCWGECDCKVKAIIGSDGSIDVGCSCPGCKMVTSNQSF